MIEEDERACKVMENQSAIDESRNRELLSHSKEREKRAECAKLQTSLTAINSVLIDRNIYVNHFNRRL